MGLFDNLRTEKPKKDRRNTTRFTDVELNKVHTNIDAIFNGDKEGFYLVASKEGDTNADVKSQIKSVDSMELAQIIVDSIGKYVDPELYEYMYKKLKKRGDIE